MAVIQISRIQHRRGLEADLPNLSSAELGWSVDTRKLYIGNGTIEEGAPSLGKTEVLTQYSILDFQTSFTANVEILQANVAVIEGNIVSLTSQVNALTAATTPTYVSLGSSSSGVITNTEANNAVIAYTLLQGTNQRAGTINMVRNGATIDYSEEFNETAPTDIVFTIDGNTTTANLKYTTTTATTVAYTFNSLI